MLAMALSLAACGDPIDVSQQTTTTQLTAADLYNQLIAYSNKENAELGAKWYLKYQSVLKEYEMADEYYTYCLCEYWYGQGKIGQAYKTVMSLPDVAGVVALRTELAEKLTPFEGTWVQYNGKGSYLYVSFKDGYAATDVVSMYDDSIAPSFTDKDYRKAIVILADDFAIDGEYGVYYFADDDELMLVKMEDAAYNTFAGVYERYEG